MGYQFDMPTVDAFIKASKPTEYIRGVNFTAGGNAIGIPGQGHGWQYLYPTHAEIDEFAAKGFKAARLQFKWENLQKTLNGPLDAAELALLKDRALYIVSKGMFCEIEPHNYAQYAPGGYGQPGYYIGSVQVPNAAFGDFWFKVAQVFKGEPKISFGLINEPNNAASAWFPAAAVAIVAIRQAGAANRIGVPGVFYTSANGWFSSGSAQGFLQYIANPKTGFNVDVLNNFYIDLHNYLDNDEVGDSNEVQYHTTGVLRLQRATEWCRDYGFKARHGETNAGDNTMSATSGPIKALVELERFKVNNFDVWEGTTFWANGVFFADSYIFKMMDLAGVPRTRTTLLAAEAIEKPFPHADAVLDFDFVNNRIYGAASMYDVLSVTQAGRTLVDGNDGKFSIIAPNLLRRTNRGLLVEESRVNRITTTLYQPTLNECTIRRGIASPDGGKNAVRMTDNLTVSARHYARFVSEVGSLTNTNNYAFSVYAKRVNPARPYDAWLFFTAPSSWAYPNLGNPSQDDRMLGDWQRLNVNLVNYTGIGYDPRFGITPSGDIGNGTEPGAYTGLGTDSIDFFMPQFEEGLFPTSPIYNNKKGTTVTRAADIVEFINNAKAYMDGDFTIVMTMQWLPRQAVVLPILIMEDAVNGQVAAIRRNANYSIGSVVGAAAAQTTAVPERGLSEFASPRKVGLSVRRSGTARVTLGLENVAAVAQDQAIPATTHFYIGQSCGFVLDAQIYSGYVDTAAMDTLLLQH